MAQELLTTFEETYVDVKLVKSTPGSFAILCDDQEIYSKKRDGGFPEPTMVKQRVRDIIAPGMSLGHGDIKKE